MNCPGLVKEKLRGDSPQSFKNAGPFRRPAPVPDMSATPLRMKVVLLAALAGTGLVSAAWAQDVPRERRGAERSERSQDQRLRNREALSDSVRQFERSNRGSRVLSAERIQADGRDVNRIKAMDDRGRVRVYVDDPRRQPQAQPRRQSTRDDHD